MTTSTESLIVLWDNHVISREQAISVAQPNCSLLFPRSLHLLSRVFLREIMQQSVPIVKQDQESRVRDNFW